MQVLYWALGDVAVVPTGTIVDAQRLFDLDVFA